MAYEEMERARIESERLSKFGSEDYEKTVLDARTKARLEVARIEGVSQMPDSISKPEERQRQLRDADAEIHRCQIILNEEMNFGVECPPEKKVEHARRLDKKELNLGLAEQAKHMIHLQA